ncbi:hypothetical protein [Algoriphagus sp.]|uniref:hypothetical protein n=1 Tax=Algoriphagus sp. TaxID=1872435 RepID=UPI00262D3C6E|nr:hypothetical protein [Algoriphagus sp.]
MTIRITENKGVTYSAIAMSTASFTGIHLQCLMVDGFPLERRNRRIINRGIHPQSFGIVSKELRINDPIPILCKGLHIDLSVKLIFTYFSTRIF